MTQTRQEQYEYQKRWRQENRDKYLEIQRRHTANAKPWLRDDKKEYQARWRAANAEKLREDKRKWAAENRETLRVKKNAWRAANRDKVNAQWSRNYAENADMRLRALFAGTKARAKRDGIAFDLRFDEIVWVETCPVLGIQINYEFKNKQRGDDSPSLDRTRPELGYTKGNVVVMSWRANRIKYDTTIDELDKLAVYMRKVRSN